MRWEQPFLTVTPAVAFLGLILLGWDVVETFAMYAPTWLLWIPLVCLLPLSIHICRWVWSSGKKVPHPFGILLPVGLVIVFPLWFAGERLAREIPGFCSLGTGYEVKPLRPGKVDPTATFSVGALGWGNSHYFEFTLVTFRYASAHCDDDLYVSLPQWHGHYTDTYTTNFPVTREKVLEYVRQCDEFPPGDAEVLADQLWELLQKYQEKRDMPPIVYGSDRLPEGQPQIIYSVSGRAIYGVTLLLAVPILIIVAWFLAGWYCRRVLVAASKATASHGSQSSGC